MRPLTSWITRGWLLGGLLLLGCSRGPQLAEVSGKVVMNGKPLKNVKVSFQPDPEKGTRGAGSAGTTDENGNFTLTYGPGKPGAIVGHHRITLEDLDLYGTEFVGRGDYRTSDNAGGFKETPKKPRFPAVYTILANTPLKEEVKPGMGPVTIDVK